MADSIKSTSKIKVNDIDFVTIVLGFSYCVKDGKKLGCTTKTFKKAVLKVLNTILCKQNHPTCNTPF